MKKGFTLIETLVVIAIIVILIALIAPAVVKVTNHVNAEPVPSFVAKVVEKYPVSDRHGLQAFRINVVREGFSNHVETLTLDYAFGNETAIATAYANLIPDHWYRLSVRGTVDETWDVLPMIVEIEEVDPPTLE